MNRFRSRMAVVVLSAASVGAGFLGYNVFQNVQFAHAQEQVQATREQLKGVEDLSTVFRNVGKVVEPSVVNIHVRKKVSGVGPRASIPRNIPDDMLRRFFPDRDGDGEPDFPTPDEDAMEQVGTGSGVIMELVDGGAFIVTNNHVAGGAEEMTITLSDGREITKAKLVGADPKSDLAVVRIEADRLIPAKWGNSDELDKGDWVLAFGSPFGFVGSMTHGIVSALNRQSNPQGGEGILGRNGYENFIQVDAPINPGNSGGPLTNVKGEVIGITTAIASASGGFQGIGFAIPSNQAKFVYTALKDKGKVTRGWIGVSIENVAADMELAQSFGYQGSNGIIVQSTIPGTPAYGKLQKGDIITSLNGKPAKNVLELRNTIAVTAPNSEVKLGIFRNGKSEEVALKVGEQPDDMVAAARGRGGRGSPGRSGSAADNDSASTKAESLGLHLGELTEERAARLGVTDIKGAVVMSIDPRSPAAKARIGVGDVVTNVGGTEVKSADEATAAFDKVDVSKGVRLYVANREGSRFVFVKPLEKSGSDKKDADNKDDEKSSDKKE